MKAVKCLILTFAASVTIGSAPAAISIHGSATAYTTTDKDWLTHTANDIDGNGLGTDGWFFFGDFDGNSENNQPFTHNTQSLPAYVTSVAAGADFISVADEFSNVSPGYGTIDDPTALNGTDARSGAAVAAGGGGAGSSSDILQFTVFGLTETARVGILSGTEQSTNGRWDPTSIMLRDGTFSATVGDTSTNLLPAIPDSTTPNNVGWVFFDIDTDGTYTVSGTQRLATQGVSVGGLTFDTIPEPSTSLMFVIATAISLLARRRRLQS